MKTLIAVISGTIILMLSSFTKDNVQTPPGSRMVYFNYLGYGDTIYAVVHGRVYIVERTPQGEERIIPVSGATITAELIGKSVKTDRDGRFSIGLAKGVYTLIVTNGSEYQALKMTNYVAVPDQFSDVKIILEKGSGMQTVKIPPRKY